MGETISTNKKAYRDYFLTDQIECGIELQGSEVKSARAGFVHFKDTFARIDKGQMFLYNLQIDSYTQASYLNASPDRVRRLLLHKKQIEKCDSMMRQKGGLLIPTKIYFNNRGLVKIEIALAKGKKQYDKREDIKKRDIDRSIRRTINNRNQR